MKQKFILLTFLISCIGVYAQKCKYQKNEVDEFTGYNVIVTKEKALTKIGMGLGNYCSVRAESINGDVRLRIRAYSPSIFTIERGDYLMLKTMTGEVIELKFSNSVVADYVMVDQLNATIWNASVYIDIDKNVLKKLYDISLKKVRWYTTEGYIEKDVPKKHSDNLSKLLNCVI